MFRVGFMLFAFVLVTGCSSTKLKEPLRSFVFNTIMEARYPVTVALCFEPKFDPAKGFDTEAIKNIEKCVEEFKKNKEESDAWDSLLLRVQNIEEEGMLGQHL